MLTNIEKLSSRLHCKLLISLVCIGIIGVGYIGGKVHQYHSCNLNNVFRQQSFTSPSLNSLVSDALSDNIADTNTSDSNQDPTYDMSDSDDFYKSIWFKHGRIGFDNSSVWLSDMNQDALNNWSDDSDDASKYSFCHDNHLDPSDKISVKHVNKISHDGLHDFNFTNQANKYSNDNLTVPHDNKYITYHVSHHHNLILTIHQPEHHIDYPSDTVQSITYHLQSIHGLLNTQYKFKPIKVTDYNHKPYKSYSAFKLFEVHPITLTTSAQIHAKS